MIQEYKNELLIGKPCMVHDEFVPAMDEFCSYLKTCGLKYDVTSSGRMNTDVPHAIVTPAVHGNHLVFHAVDGNLIDKNGVDWTSEKIKQEGLSGDVLEFVKLVRSSKILRYGGDFNTPDEVHYDDGLNIRNPKHWQEIYNTIHNLNPTT